MRAFWGVFFAACANPSVQVDAPVVSTPAPLATTGQQSSVAEGETVLWSTLADLDGDGVPERITLRSSQLKPRDLGPHDATWMNVPVEGACGETCAALLRIGSVERKINIALRREDSRGGLGVRVTGLSSKDGQRELLLRQQTGDDEISWAAVDLATYRKGAITYHELWGRTWPGNRSEVVVEGNGRLELRFHTCARTTIVAYAREGAGLRKVEERIQVTGDASKCSG